MVKEALRTSVTLPIAVVVGIVGLATGGVGSWVGVQVAISELRGDVRVQAAKQDAINQSHDREIAGLHEVDRVLGAKVDGLRTDVDRLKGGRP